MKLKFTITGYYNIPDDPKDREQLYETSDPVECALIDEQNLAPEELIGFVDDADAIKTKVEPVYPTGLVS